MKNTSNNLLINVDFDKSVLQEALTLSKIAIWEYDFKSERISFNDCMHEILGFSEPIVMSSLLAYKSLINPQDFPVLMRLVNDCKLVKCSNNLSIQFRMRTQEGSWKWIENKSSLKLDSEGNPVKCLGVLKDISQLKEEEQRRERNSHHLNEVVNSLNDVMYEFDQNCNIINCWVHENSMFKDRIMSFIGKNVSDVFNSRVAKASKITIAKTFMEKKNQTAEYYSPKADIHYLAKTTLVNDVYLQEPRVTVIVQDVTKEKKIQLLLEKNKSNLDAMIQNTSDVFWTLDINNKLILYNNAFEKLTGKILNRKPVVGESLCVGRLLKESLNNCKAIHDRSLKGLKTKIIRPVHYSDGVKVVFEFQINPLINKEEKVIGSVISGRDITEIYEAKITAEKQTVLKSKFISTISHEIRTPLNAILGTCDHLQNFNQQKELVEDIDILNLASENLHSIINDVLDFSKLESGKTIITNAPFDLKIYLNSFGKLHEKMAMDKNLKFNIHFDSGIPKIVNFDKSKLNQILTNIVNNAIKYTNSGNVNLRVTSIERVSGFSNLEFMVTDTGIGIPKNEFEYIFDSYTQSSTSQKELIGGTGLGLSIVKSLVDTLGGEVGILSSHAYGTKVSVKLKMEIVEPNTQTIINVQSPSLEGLQVLVAEDNEVNAKIISRLLDKWGASSDLAINGEIAFEYAKQKKYDVILMDIQMPVMDGFESSYLIKTEFGNINKFTPIIALTAQPDFKTDNSYQDFMFDGHVLKPFHPEELKQKLVGFVNQEKNISNSRISEVVVG